MQHTNKQIFAKELSAAIHRLNSLVRIAARQQINVSIFPVMEREGAVECGVLGYQLKKTD